MHLTCIHLFNPCNHTKICRDCSYPYFTGNRGPERLDNFIESHRYYVVGQHLNPRCLSPGLMLLDNIAYLPGEYVRDIILLCGLVFHFGDINPE